MCVQQIEWKQKQKELKIRHSIPLSILSTKDRRRRKDNLKQESPADAGIPARRKNDEKNSSISKL